MRRPAQRGFTLVECIAALAVLALFLLGSAAFLTYRQRVETRIAADRQLLHALELAVETVRTQDAALTPATSVVAVADTMPDCAPELRVEVLVAATETAGLFRVVASGAVQVAGRPLRRELETLLWRPS
jgi:prepilin-type N-terminal cleavage/methylation domain-containing protein